MLGQSCRRTVALWRFPSRRRSPCWIRPNVHLARRSSVWRPTGERGCFQHLGASRPLRPKLEYWFRLAFIYCVWFSLLRSCPFSPGSQSGLSEVAPSCYAHKCERTLVQSVCRALNVQHLLWGLWFGAIILTFNLLLHKPTTQPTHPLPGGAGFGSKRCLPLCLTWLSRAAESTTLKNSLFDKHLARRA